MVQSRAVSVGWSLPVLAHPLAEVLALLELIVCESEKAAEQVQDMWDRARPLPAAPPRSRGEDRRAEVARFMEL